MIKLITMGNSNSAQPSLANLHFQHAVLPFFFHWIQAFHTLHVDVHNCWQFSLPQTEMIQMTFVPWFLLAWIPWAISGCHWSCPVLSFGIELVRQQTSGKGSMSVRHWRAGITWVLPQILSWIGRQTPVEVGRSGLRLCCARCAWLDNSLQRSCKWQWLLAVSAIVQPPWWGHCVGGVPGSGQ